VKQGNEGEFIQVWAQTTTMKNYTKASFAKSLFWVLELIGILPGRIHDSLHGAPFSELFQFIHRDEGIRG